MTVHKTWKDGEDIHDPSDRIGEEMAKIAEEQGVKLSLVLQLEFANQQNGWDISRGKKTSEGKNSDTIQLGDHAEAVPIYNAYLPDDDHQYRYDTTATASSRQPLIWIDENGKAQSTRSIRYFNLPKYDQSGEVVSYTVKELWLAEQGENTLTYDLTNKTESMQFAGAYPDLYELVKDYSIEEAWDYTVSGTQHTRDFQTLDLTNKRSKVTSPGPNSGRTAPLMTAICGPTFIWMCME